MTDIELLTTEYQTLFLLTETGRIERENDPEDSPGARLWLAGCASGNIIGLRHDVGNDCFGRITALATTEPPFVGKGIYPHHFGKYVEFLAKDGIVPKATLGLIYHLPNNMFPSSVNIHTVDSDSDAGKRLYEKLSAEGIPDSLKEVGFQSLADFWEPWCAVFHEGEIVSVACASRLSSIGAELGLTTVTAFRGRGYGAAATVAWTRLSSLQNHTLFYSTSQTNVSSQRVIERLGLRYIGSSLRLT